MPDRKLATIGAQLGKTGTISLKEIHVTASSQLGADGYKRIYLTSAGYKRINPFEVANGTAPDPHPTTNFPPYTLAAWGDASKPSYTQTLLSKTYAKPTNVDITDVGTPTAANNANFELSWTIPNGFTDFNTNGVDTDIFNRIYARICSDQGDGGSVGNAGPNGCEDVADDDPIANINGGTTANADTSPVTVSSLTQNTWYAVACRIEWDDTGTQTIGSFTNVSDAGAVVASATETCCNVTEDVGAGRIYFRTPVWVCTSDSLGISTTNVQEPSTPRDETNDSRCEACYNWNQIGNRVTRYRGTSTDAIGTSAMNLYTNSTCTTEDTTTIWYSDDGDTAYQLGTTNSWDCQVDCSI